MVKALKGPAQRAGRGTAPSSPSAEISERDVLFISHANPEDNAFAIWLGAHLSSLGYEVWADIMRLRGGQDWSRELETVLRRRACKMLFAGTVAAASKPGTRAEIEIAAHVAQELQDDCFVIPLRLEQHEVPFRIARAQHIDFSNGWALGLTELIETLESYRVPRAAASTPMWRQLQCLYAKELETRSERLISNWLAAELPSVLRYYDFSGPISQVRIESKIREAPFGGVPHLRGFFSFADPDDLYDHFGGPLSVKLLEEYSTEAFLSQGSQRRSVEPWQASRTLVDLSRQAVERRLQTIGLARMEMGDGRIAWWPPRSKAPAKRLRFRWGDIEGSRQLQGYFSIGSSKLYWHYGVSPVVQMRPMPHVAMIGRLVFTEDGERPIDARRAHRLRRSLAKSWRNEKWRDIMLAFLHWISEGRDELVVPAGASQALRLQLPPVSFDSPVTFHETPSRESDEEDLPESEWDALVEIDDAEEPLDA